MGPTSREAGWSLEERGRATGSHRPCSFFPLERGAAAPLSFLWASGQNPSPQPPPRNGEGEQAKQYLFFSPSPLRGGGWGEGFSRRASGLSRPRRRR